MITKRDFALYLLKREEESLGNQQNGKDEEICRGFQGNRQASGSGSESPRQWGEDNKTHLQAYTGQYVHVWKHAIVVSGSS